MEQNYLWLILTKSTTTGVGYDLYDFCAFVCTNAMPSAAAEADVCAQLLREGALAF